jgi:hypothetical protein
MKLAKLAVIPAFALGLGLAACSQAVSVTPAVPPPVKVKINNNIVVNPSPSRVVVPQQHAHAPKPVYVPAPAPAQPDPFAVVSAYVNAMGGQTNLPYAWSLLSSGEQSSMGSYSQWAADRSDISAEYATQINESGDQVTVSLRQNHYDGSSSNTKATFTVDDGVITAVS